MEQHELIARITEIADDCVAHIRPRLVTRGRLPSRARSDADAALKQVTGHELGA